VPWVAERPRAEREAQPVCTGASGRARCSSVQRGTDRNATGGSPSANSTRPHASSPFPHLPPKAKGESWLDGRLPPDSPLSNASSPQPPQEFRKPLTTGWRGASQCGGFALLLSRGLDCEGRKVSSGRFLRVSPFARPRGVHGKLDGGLGGSMRHAMARPGSSWSREVPMKAVQERLRDLIATFPHPLPLSRPTGDASHC
jgi:hypothetical protein